MHMRRIVLIAALLFASPSSAHTAEKELKLIAPDGWSGERILLPPGFAPGMMLTGIEEIRFAPGMFKPDSDSFFSYVFVFQLDAKPELTHEVLQRELLVYYRGLATTVLKGRNVKVEPNSFTLKLSKQKSIGGPENLTGYAGDLNWLEPFRTRKAQTLHLEVHAWRRAENNYLFVCVSPMKKSAAIWKELHEIRSEYYQSLDKK